MTDLENPATYDKEKVVNEFDAMITHIRSNKLFYNNYYTNELCMALYPIYI